ncbi:hypothetical protein ACTHGU_08315 [Chitinophagaceae bacterium MMS25-I14]
MVPFIIEIFKRIRSDSPAFFVKLRIAMIISGVLLAAFRVVTGNGLLQIAQNIRSISDPIITQALVVISTVTGVTFLPTTDPALIGSDVKEAVIRQAIDDNHEAIVNAPKQS